MRTEQCFIRRCLFRLSARVSIIGHSGHLCCSGLWDFMCFFMLFTSLPHTWHDSGLLYGLLLRVILNDWTMLSKFIILFFSDSCGILFSSTPLLSPERHVIFFISVVATVWHAISTITHTAQFRKPLANVSSLMSIRSHIYHMQISPNSEHPRPFVTYDLILTNSGNETNRHYQLVRYPKQIDKNIPALHDLCPVGAPNHHWNNYTDFFTNSKNLKAYKEFEKHLWHV